VLTPFDDYPLHQTSQPLAVPASGDPNHYDRFFFNGYRHDGSLVFGAAMGLYPNRQVIDAAFSVVRGGEQVSVLASGRCPLDRTATAVGPVEVRILQPMAVLQVLVDAPAQGLRADLVFRGRSAPLQEPPFLLHAGTRTVMDVTRLTQFGTWDGWIEIDGAREEVTADSVLGCRDRSWGVRTVGERAGGAPGPAPQYFWLWAPVNFGDLCTHFDVNERSDGSRWHAAGFVVPVGDGDPVAARSVDYRLAWRPGTRRAAWCDIDLVGADGATQTVRLEPTVEFQMLGLGYLHPEWGHGCWQGELAVTAARWSLPVPDTLAPHHLHVQALCRARLGDREGIGVLEQLVIGPHAPSGLSGLLDGAPG
jgi:hypothetical protein